MDSFEGCTDEELIRRYRRGEAAVSDFLMEKYKGMVRRKARTLFLAGGDVDDLIQEGMIGLFKAVRDYEEGREASFLTFARICVDRQLYRTIQGSLRLKNLPLNNSVSLSEDPVLSELSASQAKSPEAILIDQENVKTLEETIQGRLSKLENEVLRYYLRGENYVQIGRRVGKPPKAIDNAIQRIRKKIKEAVEKTAS